MDVKELRLNISVLILIFTLVIESFLPIYASWTIGNEASGNLIFILSLTNTLVVFATFGLNLVVIRDLAREDGSLYTFPFGFILLIVFFAGNIIGSGTNLFYANSRIYGNLLGS